MVVRSEQILQLLGQDRRKYHSAVLTTFSFNFAFFEMQAMRSLRAAGLRNVLVLIDERNLNTLTDWPSGYEHAANSAYGLYPMEAPGAFHPKILFLTGKRQGLLAIGSGNLTAAGHGSNDELWSIYHIKDGAQPQLELFQQVWSYLKQLTSEVQGSAREKLSWLEQYTPWLAGATGTVIGKVIALGQESLQLLPIAPGDKKIEQLLEAIGTEEVKAISCISPYFDHRGELIKACQRQFPTASLKIITSQESQLLPYALAGYSGVSFYDWSLLGEEQTESEQAAHRLHAKLLHFQLANGGEVFLIGSSNATYAGWGTATSPARNHELNLLVRRKKASVLRELGIAFKDTALFELPAEAPEAGSSSNTTSVSAAYSLQIKYVELEHNELLVGTKRTTDQAVVLVLLDALGSSIYQQKVDSLAATLTLRLPDELLEQNLPKFALWQTEEGEKISNQQLILSLGIHHKANPDPEQEKAQQLLADLEGGEYQMVAELLEYLLPSEKGSKSTPAIGSVRQADKTSKEKDYLQYDSYEEFTAVSADNLARQQKNYLQSLPVRLADFLTTVRKRQFDPTASAGIKEGEQNTDMDSLEGEEEDASIFVSHQDIPAREKLKTALSYHLKKYTAQLRMQTKSILDQLDHRKTNLRDCTITDYSNFLICSELIVAHTQQYIDQETAEGDVVFSAYSAVDSANNLDSFCMNTLGRFLLLQMQSPATYEYEHLKKKMHVFQRRACFYSIFLICNRQWRQSESLDKKLFLMNSTIPLLQNAEFDSKTLSVELKKWIQEKQANGVFISAVFQRQLDEYLDQLYPLLVEAFVNKDTNCLKINETSELSVNDFIFRSTLGVCRIAYTFKKRDGSIDVDLYHPGFSSNAKGERWMRQETRKRYKQVKI